MNTNIKSKPALSIEVTKNTSNAPTHKDAKIGTKLKITLKNCLPILIWIVISLEEMILSERFTYFLLFAIILLIQEKNQKEQIETNDIKQN